MSNRAGSLSVVAALAVLVGNGGVGNAAAKDRAKKESETIAITLRVYDYVRMDRRALLSAEGEATAILGEAGLKARWVDCPTSHAELEYYPDCLSALNANDFVLRVLPNAMVEPQAKWQEALGVTLDCDVGGICTTSIFLDRVQDMVQGANASMPVLLGRAMAHEIGHLLLGANSHSSAGIMHSRWFGEDLTLAGRRHLLFTAEQSRQMKTRLTERAHAWQTKAVGLGR